MAFISALSRFFNELSQIFLGLLDSILVMCQKSLDNVVTHASDFHMFQLMAISDVWLQGVTRTENATSSPLDQIVGSSDSQHAVASVCES